MKAELLRDLSVGMRGEVIDLPPLLAGILEAKGLIRVMRPGDYAVAFPAESRVVFPEENR